MSKGGSVVLAMVMIILKNLFWTSQSPLPFQLQVNVQYLYPFGVQRRVFAYQSRLKSDLTCTQFFLPNQYLCDGAPDCVDAYDEDPRLCTAGNS